VVNASPRYALGQSEAAVAVRNGPSDPPPRKGPGAGPWVNRVPVDFLDARKNGGIGHRFGWMLLVLEGYCRARSYCWVGNAELADAFGCKRSALKALLTEMVDKELIHRQMTVEGRGRPDRVGIVLLKRANPDLPVAGPDNLGDVIALMMGTIEDHRNRRHGQQTLPLSGPMEGRKTDPSGAGKPTPPRGRKTDPRIKTLSCEEREIEEGPPNPRTEFLSLSLNDNDRTPDVEPDPEPLVTTSAGAVVAVEPDPTTTLEAVDLVELPEPPAMGIELTRTFGVADPEAIRSRPSVPAPAPMPPAPRPMVTVPAAGGVAPRAREEAEDASRGCDRCDGTGLATVWHPRPDAARRIPESKSAYCTCPHGRWIERNHRERSPELRGGFVDIAEVLEGRSVWLAAPPDPSSVVAPDTAPAGPPRKPYTRGQIAWRDTLTGDQLARLDAIPSTARNLLLEPHRDGFDPSPILAEHTRQALAPKCDASSVTLMPTTLDGVLPGLRGAPPHWALHAAEMLTRALDDRHSWRAHRKVAEAVWRGEFGDDKVLDSLRQAMKPGVKVRGAVFSTAMKNHGFRWEDS